MLEEEYARVSFELGCRVEDRLTAIVQPLDAYRRSIDAAELIMLMEDKYHLKIPVEEAQKILSTHDAIEYIMKHAK